MLTRIHSGRRNPTIEPEIISEARSLHPCVRRQVQNSTTHPFLLDKRAAAESRPTCRHLTVEVVGP
jgi:hypothetical protein